MSTTASPSPDASRGHRAWHTWVAVLFWMAAMAPLVPWGLPTSRYDPTLFGGAPPWPAKRYDAGRALQARRTRLGGADTDLNPITAAGELIDLTADDARRGEILLRYRLYSRQPDEMITFQALARMDPRSGDLDPRLYQYGGGFIYLVGAAVGLCHVLGLTQLSADPGVYLTHPALFARFYLAARIVTLLFGALLLVAAARLARRAAGRAAGWAAFVLVAASPVFITGVLEAKPHLPSVCLVLWATLAALAWHAHRRPRDLLRLGAAAGYALGLVLTGLAAALLWPVLALAHGPRRRVWRSLALAALLALAVYAVTNPFVVYNALCNRAALAGNLGNSTAMYRVGDLPAGAWRVVTLLVEACGPVVVIVGLLALVRSWRRWRRETLLVIAPGAAMVLLCVAIGAGKPAEFGRFLLLPAVLLAVGSAIAIADISCRHPGRGVIATLLVLLTMRTPAYVRNFAIDARFEHESRHRAAAFLETNVPASAAIGVVQVPAPYATPPLNFARRTVLLLPQDPPPPQARAQLPPWLVLTADDAACWRGAWWARRYELAMQFSADPWLLSRIAWANKPVYVFRLAGAKPTDESGQASGPDR